MVARVRSFLAVALVSLFVPLAGSAADYSSLLSEKSRSIIPVKFTVKMTVTRGGESNTRDIAATANGVLVNSNGLLLMSARQLKGPAMFQRGNRPNISFETVARDFKARMPDGSWIETTLEARDSGLDLAFVKIKGDLSEYDQLRALELPDEPRSPKIGQEIVHVSRSRKGLNYEPHFLKTMVNARIDEPRLRYRLMDGAGMLASYIASPGFDSDGNFLGLATFRGDGSSGNGRSSMSNPYANMSKNQQFLLPAKAIKSAIEDFGSR